MNELQAKIKIMKAQNNKIWDDIKPYNYDNIDINKLMSLYIEEL